jgi:hypothetical protein
MACSLEPSPFFMKIHDQRHYKKGSSTAGASRKALFPQYPENVRQRITKSIRASPRRWINGMNKSCLPRNFRKDSTNGSLKLFSTKKK